MGGLTLGNIDASGNLNTTSTDGAINQAANTAIVVDGSTTLAASQDGQPANITLDGAANNFVGTVNAAGAGITLVDGTDGMTIGTLNALGDVLVASAGPLDLGTSTITGTLTADSGGGDILQSGPLLVDGMATFNAGVGMVSLTDPGNNLKAGSTVLASSYKIEGDARQIASDLAARTKSSTTTPVTAPGTGLSNATAPAPLVLSSSAVAGSTSTSGSSGSSSSGTSSSGATGSNSGVTIDLRDSPSSSSSIMAAVSLPKGTATAGTGFSFELPDTIRAMAQQSNQVQATMPDGAPLPAWLKFDPQRLRFDATAVPDSAFPMQVVMTIGQQRVTVVIAERTE